MHARSAQIFSIFTMGGVLSHARVDSMVLAMVFTIENAFLVAQLHDTLDPTSSALETKVHHLEYHVNVPAIVTHVR